jgi:prolipoprotein diacylglyceryltransferase
VGGAVSQEVVSEHAIDLTAQQQHDLAVLINSVALPKDSFEAGYDRLLDKIQHGSGELAAKLEPFISARHPSQLYQAFAEGLVLLGFLWFVAARPRKPGVVGAWFLIAYGVLRIATEFWRLPDVGIQKLLGLSRGQQLSALMVLVGVISMAIVARRVVAKNPGWLSKRA